MKHFVTTLHCIGITIRHTLGVFRQARRNPDPGRRWFHSMARQWAQELVQAAGISLSVEGLDLLSPDRQYVYVANHASYMDIPIVLATLPGNLIIVYKKELEKIPLFGPMLKISPLLPIERENPRKAFATLRQALHLADQKRSLLLFPEGTRTPTGKLQPFKRGAFHLALQAGLPVVPVAIAGTYDILPRHRWTITPNRSVAVFIGEPIEVPAQRSKQQERHILQQAEQTIQTLLQRHRSSEQQTGSSKDRHND